MGYGPVAFSCGYGLQTCRAAGLIFTETKNSLEWFFH